MKMPCYLVRDLLPLYKDQVCEPDTAAAVKEHLEECSDCRALWENMENAAPEEKELESAKAQEQAAALRKARGTLRKKIWGPVAGVVLLAVAVLAVSVLGFRHWALGVMLDVRQEDIADVYCTDTKELRVQMVQGKSYTSLQSTYVPIQDESGTYEAAIFTMQVDLWSSLTHNGWQGDTVLFYNTLDTAQEAYFVAWDDWESVQQAAKGTDGDYVMTDVPDTMHLLWQRDDAAAPAAP